MKITEFYCDFCKVKLNDRDPEKETYFGGWIGTEYHKTSIILAHIIIGENLVDDVCLDCMYAFHNTIMQLIDSLSRRK